jgi:hypothetical protein
MSAAVSGQPTGPEPKFWTRYSPNQELPISWLTSAALHVFALIGLTLLFNLVIGSSRDAGMPMELFEEGVADAGGGGDPNATQVNSNPASGRVERSGPDELPADMPKPTTALSGLPDVRDALPDLPEDPQSNRTVDSAAVRARLDAASKAAPPGPPQSAGRGGPGAGGGQGTGTGVGTGSGNQPGTQGSMRQRRNKRWTLSFSTTSGSQYLGQLHALGAILVADYPDGSRVMYRHLDRLPTPPEPVDSDIRTRMVWVDERPGSVRDLADAMQLDRTPHSIKAFFPYKLEDEMLKLELSYRGRKEEEIHSTVFRVIVERGQYRLYVSEQRYN